MSARTKSQPVRTLRWCPDGHTWIDQGDATVSPSWGLGGTHLPVEDPLRCPEPRTNDDGEIWCDSCRAWKTTLADCLQGLSFSPWEDGQWCEPPPPACLQPAVGEGHRWDEQHLPFDDSCWCAWWVRNDGPWRLTFHQGCDSRMWAATYRCLDVHTGETFDIDRTWSARRALLDEYPAHLRERWWTTGSGTLIGCWSTMDKGGAGYLISRRQVEAWVRDAVERGEADVGRQLALDLTA